MSILLRLILNCHDICKKLPVNKKPNKNILDDNKSFRLGVLDLMLDLRLTEYIVTLIPLLWQSF